MRSIYNISYFAFQIRETLILCEVICLAIIKSAVTIDRALSKLEVIFQSVFPLPILPLPAGVWLLAVLVGTFEFY